MTNMGKKNYNFLFMFAVTPRAGVWIEIDGTGPLRWLCVTSLPVRECGLKCLMIAAICIKVPVTPRAGVWIEISRRVSRKSTPASVTPRAGVWIEILAFRADT